MAWFDLSWRLLLLRLATAIIVWAFAAPIALYLALTLLLRFIWSPFSGFWRPQVRDQPPDVLQSASLGQHAYVILDKGIKIHYVHNGDATRPLMLFLHGFPEFWFSWKHQLQEFAQDYWVVAVDMRGYGDSDKPSGTASYRADILVDDVKEILEAFERPSAVLVGHGWGGAVAWMFAERYPERVERLVSIGSPHPYAFQRAVTLSRKQLLRSWYLFLFQVPYLPELLMRCDDLACLGMVLRRGRRRPPTLTDEDLEAYKYAFSQPGAFTGPLNYYRAAGWGLPRRWRSVRKSTAEYVGDKDDGAEEVGTEPCSADIKEDIEVEEVEQDKDKDSSTEAKALPSVFSDNVSSSSSALIPTLTPAPMPPALVLLGGRDAFVEHSTAFRTRKMFPNVSVVIIRDANHFVHIDDPTAVNKALRKFLVEFERK